MAVVAVFEFPTFTQERYEQAIGKLAGKARMESPADWPVEGLLAHVAGHTEKGFRVVDVWASEEAWTTFAEAVGPLMQELGMDGRPEVFSPHTLVIA